MPLLTNFSCNGIYCPSPHFAITLSKVKISLFYHILLQVFLHEGNGPHHIWAISSQFKMFVNLLASDGNIKLSFFPRSIKQGMSLICFDLCKSGRTFYTTFICEFKSIFCIGLLNYLHKSNRF